jgi:hypothetical protein
MMSRFLPHRVTQWIRSQVGNHAHSTGRFDVAQYWETRYAAGGNSGEGSYGRLAEFKARVINEFVVEHRVQNVVEFGCGDGNQLSLLRVPQYVGLDVSQSVIRRCIQRFQADTTKSFFLLDGACFHDTAGLFAADLALSLDVIFHLVEDEDFESYMTRLCDSSRKYLILYTTDYDRVLGSHERHRRVSPWMRKRPDFELIRAVPNPYAGTRDNHEESDAGFLIYQRALS